MYNDFKTYFYDNIAVPYLEYIGETESGSFGRNNDLKKAVDCALKLYHLREHVIINPTCTQIIGLCSDYKVIQDVTNLSKHNSPPRHNPIISSLNQIIQLIITTKFKDEKGEYSDIDKVIKITKDDGTELFLHDALYSVISFWNEYLYNNNLIDRKFSLKAPNPIGELKQRSECKKMDLEIIQGMPFELHTQLMEWDYDKKKALPIDLTGTTVEFKVYKKPQLLPEIKIQNDKTGEISNVEINLLEEDLIKFNTLETYEDKKDFVEKLDYVQEILRKALRDLPK